MCSPSQINGHSNTVRPVSGVTNMTRKQSRCYLHELHWPPLWLLRTQRSVPAASYFNRPLKPHDLFLYKLIKDCYILIHAQTSSPQIVPGNSHNDSYFEVRLLLRNTLRFMSLGLFLYLIIHHFTPHIKLVFVVKRKIIISFTISWLLISFRERIERVNKSIEIFFIYTYRTLHIFIAIRPQT